MKQQRATLCSHDRNRSTHEGELVEVKLSSYIESLAQQRSQRLHFPKDALLRSNIAGQKDDPSGTWSRNVRFVPKADIRCSKNSLTRSRRRRWKARPQE